MHPGFLWSIQGKGALLLLYLPYSSISIETVRPLILSIQHSQWLGAPIVGGVVGSANTIKACFPHGSTKATTCTKEISKTCGRTIALQFQHANGEAAAVMTGASSVQATIENL
jgi:hypothetical protein